MFPEISGNTDTNKLMKESGEQDMDMESKKCRALQGQHNKRLGKSDEQENEGTAAWTQTNQSAPKSQVSIPSEDAVIHAKEWVDNGSRL